MRASYIAFAVPFFFLLIGLELWIAKRRRRSVHRLGDMLGDIGCGMAQQTTLVFLAALILSVYVWLYDGYRLVTWQNQAVVWVIALVGVDFLYYWWHRLSHEVNLLWAAHVVHHQSEDYNLAVALRQSILTGFSAQLFYLPLAFLGVPPLVFASANAISTLYQFWIHTELVGKIGWLEKVINTPSHHRVHHAINPRYLDKNYGATLMIWDQLFGTFLVEDETCVYGVVKPLNSFNPIWAQLEPLVALAKASFRAPRWQDKIQIWFRSPAWGPIGVPPSPGVVDGSYMKRPKYEAPASLGLQVYVSTQFLTATIGTAALMFTQETAPRQALVLGAALVLSTLAACAGLLEKRAWAVPLELARLVLFVGAALSWRQEGGPIWAVPVASAVAFGFAVWGLRVSRRA